MLKAIGNMIIKRDLENKTTQITELVKKYPDKLFIEIYAAVYGLSEEEYEELLEHYQLEQTYRKKAEKTLTKSIYKELNENLKKLEKEVNELRIKNDILEGRKKASEKEEDKVLNKLHDAVESVNKRLSEDLAK